MFFYILFTSLECLIIPLPSTSLLFDRFISPYLLLLNLGTQTPLLGARYGFLVHRAGIFAVTHVAERMSVQCRNAQVRRTRRLLPDQLRLPRELPLRKCTPASMHSSEYGSAASRGILILM